MSEATDFLLRSRIRLAAGFSRTKATGRLLMWAISRGNADSGLTFRNLWKDAVRGNMTNIYQYYRYSLDYNCTERLHTLRAPVLLLYGNKDRGFKRYRRKLEKALPACDVVVLPDEKHQIPTKSALAMNESIRGWIRGIKRAKAERPEAAKSAVPTAPDPEMPLPVEVPGAEEQAEY